MLYCSNIMYARFRARIRSVKVYHWKLLVKFHADADAYKVLKTIAGQEPEPIDKPLLLLALVITNLCLEFHFHEIHEIQHTLVIFHSAF